jgi:hypothetical protein
MMKPQCVNGPIMCTCNGSTFECPIPDCPPPPLCPPPDSITPGTACTDPGAQCPGPDFSQCDCSSNGIWMCTLSLPDGGPPDAGGWVDASSSD